VVAGVVLLQHHLAAYIEVYVDTLSASQAKQLDAFLEMNRLVTTLGTGLLGAIGFLLANGRNAGSPARELWAAIASAICVGVSLLSGYVVYQSILWMLESGFFNLNNPEILWVHHAHFYSFLLGVVFFAEFAFHDLRGESGREPSQTATPGR